MKSLIFPAFLLTVAVCAQTPPPSPAPAHAEPPPETVVATYDGDQKITLGELVGYINLLPPDAQQKALHNRKEFLQEYALMHHLADMAEKAKLGQRSPTKDSLAVDRMRVMMNAQVQEEFSGLSVAPADAQAFYDKNKDRFVQVKVKAIYVSFAANSEPAADGKKHRTEAEGQAQIAKLRTDVQGGADFAKVAKENSDDQPSAAKDGDFGIMRRTDKLPDAIRTAVFALKAGQISEPVRQPNGFYLFRAEEITTQPFTEVQNDIVKELKTIQFQAWVEETKRSLNVKMQENASATSGAAPAASK